MSIYIKLKRGLVISVLETSSQSLSLINCSSDEDEWHTKGPWPKFVQLKQRLLAKLLRFPQLAFRHQVIVVHMAKRSPRFTEAELHALADGCIRRWNTLSCNNNSDTNIHEKEGAWKEIEAEVAAVSTAGVSRKWTDLRRKIQVERSNVKKKVQEIRRKRGITENTVLVPGLTQFETKIASLLTSEESCSIIGFGVAPTSTASNKIVASTSSVVLKAEYTSDIMDISTSRTASPSSSAHREDALRDDPVATSNQQISLKKLHASSNSCRNLHKENTILQNENLKLQKEVLLLQMEYYSCKLAKLHSSK